MTREEDLRKRFHVATKPAAKNFLQQQSKFDRFMRIFNDERPHEALALKYPTELYTPSPRPYTDVGDLEYPFHDRTIMVTECGRICLGRRKINLSQVFAGQRVECADHLVRSRNVDFIGSYFSTT